MDQAMKSSNPSDVLFTAEADALAKLTELSSRLWTMQSLREGLEEILAATIGLLGAHMGNVQILDAGRGVLTLAAQRGFEQDFLDFFREVSTEDDSACGRALRSGERIVIEDVEADAAYTPMRPVARAAGYRAVQSTPLIGRNGVRLGMLSTHFETPHRPTELELRGLDLYARQAADYIERCQTDQALRDSEQRFRSFADTAPAMLWVANADASANFLSRGWYEFTGQSEAEAMGKDGFGWLKAVHPDDRERVQGIIDRSYATGELAGLIEYRLLLPDGTTRWVRNIAQHEGGDQNRRERGQAGDGVQDPGDPGDDRVQTADPVRGDGQRERDGEPDAHGQERQGEVLQDPFLDQVQVIGDPAPVPEGRRDHGFSGPPRIAASEASEIRGDESPGPVPLRRPDRNGRHRGRRRPLGHDRGRRTADPLARRIPRQLEPAARPVAHPDRAHDRAAAGVTGAEIVYPQPTDLRRLAPMSR